MANVPEWPKWDRSWAVSALNVLRKEIERQQEAEKEQMNEIDKILEGCTFKALVTVLRQLNGGPLGYDFSKKDKAFLLEDAQSKARHYAATKYPGQGYTKTIADIKRWLGDDMGKEGEGDHEDDGKSKVPYKPKEGQGESKQGEGQKGNDPIEQMIQKAIKKGQKSGQILSKDTGVTQDQANDYITRAEAGEVISDIVSKKLERESRTFRIQLTKPDGKVIEIDEEPRHYAFKEVLTAVSAGLNVLLVGPAGCGKTHMAEQVSKAMELPFRFTGAVASEYKLLGFIDAQGRNVRTEYREAYETGGVFLWDEMDASAPQALLAFNSGLANGRQDFADVCVQRHQDFRAIASANTYGAGADRMYVGRNQLDAASLDRFYVVSMDYDEVLEKTLYGEHEWVQYVWKARKVVRELSIRHVVSMRAIDMGLKMIAQGFERKKFEKAILWKHMDEADLVKVKAKMGQAEQKDLGV